MVGFHERWYPAPFGSLLSSLAPATMTIAIARTAFMANDERIYGGILDTLDQFGEFSMSQNMRKSDIKIMCPQWIDFFVQMQPWRPRFTTNTPEN